MEYRPLGQTGLKVSVLSYGASSLGSVFRETNDDEGIKAVRTALEHGINFIDVSPYYGDTKAETVLGRALSGIDRSSYYLATKVGQYGNNFDFSAERVTRSLDESCERLGVDYIDLLQCHDIEFVELSQIVNETLPALHKLKQAGRVGHIGITGLPLNIFRQIIDQVDAGMVETILSFCHYELNDTSLTTLLPYLKERQVGVINAAPTGMGALTPRGAPSWHPASPAIIAGCRRAVEYCESIGEDIVKLAVQFSVAHPEIATTLVGTANPENIRKNISYAESPMNAELLVQVLEILKPIHNHNFTRGLSANQDPVLS